MQVSFQAYRAQEKSVLPPAQSVSLERFNNETESEEGVNGINDCPKSCLCSNGIKFDYKVCVCVYVVGNAAYFLVCKLSFA